MTEKEIWDTAWRNTKHILEKKEMSTLNFNLFINQYGERFIFYNSPNGSKIISSKPSAICGGLVS